MITDMINIEAIKPKTKTLAEKYGLSLILLFGSQVTGKTHKESDVDIAYLSSRKFSFDEESNIDTDLIEIFKNNEVQLVNIKKASPLFMKKIVEKCIVLYEEDRSIFTDLILHSIRMYEESSALFDLRRHYLDYKINSYQNA